MKLLAISICISNMCVCELCSGVCTLAAWSMAKVCGGNFVPRNQKHDEAWMQRTIGWRDVTVCREHWKGVFELYGKMFNIRQVVGMLYPFQRVTLSRCQCTCVTRSPIWCFEQIMGTQCILDGTSHGTCWSFYLESCSCTCWIVKIEVIADVHVVACDRNCDGWLRGLKVINSVRTSHERRQRTIVAVRAVQWNHSMVRTWLQNSEFFQASKSPWQSPWRVWGVGGCTSYIWCNGGGGRCISWHMFGACWICRRLCVTNAKY